MSEPQTAHCRLCAELKDYSKLQDLQDENKRSKAIEKLSRLGLHVNLDGTDDILPKTVCLICIDSLNKSYNFVSAVEAAQAELSSYFSIPKIESEEFDDKIATPIGILENSVDNFEYAFEKPDEICDDVSVKEELTESELESHVEAISKVYKKNKQNKEDLDELDLLPLSQIKLPWKDYVWMCAYCDTMFPDFEELKTHSMQYHDVCNAFRCTDCNSRKYKLDTFVSHASRHRTHLKLSCYRCHRMFQRPYECLTHRKSHIESVYRCVGCNTCFNNNEELTKHIAKYNKRKKSQDTILETMADNLTCKECKKSFKSKNNLKAHLVTHTERIRDHTCEICGKCFFNKYNLAGHMMFHEDKRPYQCEICKRRFRKKNQLKMHISVHSTVKPYSCEQCGRKFRLEKHLISHKIIHTDALPYVCTVCNKKFRFKSILNLHNRQHTGVKPYNCKICDRDFTNWPNYNKHMKIRHGVDTSKKKLTAEGFFPVNPKTGEVIKEPQTEKTLEWMKNILDPATKGKRKRIRKNSEEKLLTNVNPS